MFRRIGTPCGLLASIVLGFQVCMAQQFELLVTGTPPGTIDIADPANWGGVARFEVFTGFHPDAEGGIAPSSLSDPAGLVYSSSLGELFVGQRHGNTSVGSIARFLHQPGEHVFTPNGSFSAAGLVGVHQLAISSVNGELFAATLNGGVARFTPSLPSASNGTILGGPTRGVAVSPDGKRLYATTGGGVIRQFDLINGMELTPISVTDADGLHYLRFRGNDELYAADLSGDHIFRFNVIDNDLVLESAFSSPDAIGIAFSPDLIEMFVSTHGTSTAIRRYGIDAGTDEWVLFPNSTINFDKSLGDILTTPIPEPSIAVTLSVAIGAIIMKTPNRRFKSF